MSPNSRQRHSQLTAARPSPQPILPRHMPTQKVNSSAPLPPPGSFGMLVPPPARHILPSNVANGNGNVSAQARRTKYILNAAPTRAPTKAPAPASAPSPITISSTASTPPPNTAPPTRSSTPAPTKAPALASALPYAPSPITISSTASTPASITVSTTSSTPARAIALSTTSTPAAIIAPTTSSTHALTSALSTTSTPAITPEPTPAPETNPTTDSNVFSTTATAIAAKSTPAASSAPSLNPISVPVPVPVTAPTPASATSTPTLPVPPPIINTNTADVRQIDQNTPEWEAARQSVLNQMVTSQDLDAATASVPKVTKVTRGGVKTGGRRGRGGRRAKVKLEGVEETPTTTATGTLQTPEGSTRGRGKSRGGRPRGSGTSARRGGRVKSEAFVVPDTPPATEIAQNVETPTRGRTVNRGGRPRGSRAGINRGGRPRGSRAANSAASVPGRGGLTGRSGSIKKKRKRGEFDDSEEEQGHSDSSEEPTLLPTQSRSGRRITQANTFTPVILEPPESNSAKRKSSQTAGLPADSAPITASIKKPPKKRRKPGEAAVCTNCGRGHSPLSNRIVFCDGCNTPWHQYCHDRPITPSVIQIEEKEWMCADCEILRQERLHVAGKVSAEATGAEMGLKEKRTYLRGLEKGELISLLLRASTLHPDLPIFAPPEPVLHAPIPIAHNPVQLPPEEEEVYEIYVEPDPLPYPKAGNGILLPSENEDIELLIDEDVVTFSHSWMGDRQWDSPGGVGWTLNGGMAVNVGA